MNWIILLCALEIGTMPTNQWIDYTTNEWYDKPAYYATLESEVVLFNYFFAGGWAETCMMQNGDKLNFDPFQATFEFHAGIRIDIFEMGIQHICGPHPIRAYPYTKDNDPITPFEGAYDKIYIRVEQEF